MLRYVLRADDAYNCFILGRRSLLSYLDNVRQLATEVGYVDSASKLGYPSWVAGGMGRCVGTI